MFDVGVGETGGKIMRLRYAPVLAAPGAIASTHRGNSAHARAHAQTNRLRNFPAQEVVGFQTLAAPLRLCVRAPCTCCAEVRSSGVDRAG